MAPYSTQDADRDIASLLALSTTRNIDDYRQMARLSEDGDGPTRGEMSPADQAELEVLLAEYSSLRQESMNTINNRIQAMVLGLAGAAALAAGALAVPSVRSNSQLVTSVFGYAVPLICVYIVLVWLSEAVRSHRVGYFIASSSEARINAKLGRLVLTWEAALWTGLLPRDELFGPSMIALAVLGVFAGLSPWLGLALNGTHVGISGTPLVIELWVPYALLFAFVWYSTRLMPQLRNIPEIASALHKPDHETAQQ